MLVFFPFLGLDDDSDFMVEISVGKDVLSCANERIHDNNSLLSDAGSTEFPPEIFSCANIAPLASGSLDWTGRGGDRAGDPVFGCER